MHKSPSGKFGVRVVYYNCGCLLNTRCANLISGKFVGMIRKYRAIIALGNSISVIFVLSVLAENV